MLNIKYSGRHTVGIIGTVDKRGSLDMYGERILSIELSLRKGGLLLVIRWVEHGQKIWLTDPDYMAGLW